MAPHPRLLKGIPNPEEVGTQAQPTQNGSIPMSKLPKLWQNTEHKKTLYNITWESRWGESQKKSRKSGSHLNMGYMHQHFSTRISLAPRLAIAAETDWSAWCYWALNQCLLCIWTHGSEKNTFLGFSLVSWVHQLFIQSQYPGVLKEAAYSNIFC